MLEPGISCAPYPQMELTSTNYRRIRSNCTNGKVCCGIHLFLLLTIIFAIGIAGWALFIEHVNINVSTTVSTSGESRDSSDTTCRIAIPDPVRFYPNASKHVYKISFNQEIMQANYVVYVQPTERNSCKSCKKFRDDPYNINRLTDNDYIGFHKKGYDRSHLVPNADFGYDTYIISNAVPMESGFNRGVWNCAEARIRNQYKSKLIFKGCEYSMAQYLNTTRNNRLYVPLGCYFVVFDSSNIDQISGLKLLDYGYYRNTDGSFRTKKLPTWVVC